MVKKSRRPIQLYLSTMSFSRLSPRKALGRGFALNTECSNVEAFDRIRNFGGPGICLMVDHQSLLGGHARNEKARECWLGTSHRYDLRHAQICMASAPMYTACETEMPPLRDLCTRQSTYKGWDDSRRSSKPQRVKDMMYSEHKSACAAMPRPIFSCDGTGRRTASP